MENSNWHLGGCFCGAVRFRIRGESVWKAGCTCNSCVKSHGAPYVVWAGFDRNNYEVIQGNLSAYRSQPNVIREFCPSCGSTLTYCKDTAQSHSLDETANVIHIAVASLDDPDLYPPDKVMNSQERIKWLHLGDDILIKRSIMPKVGHPQPGVVNQPQEEKFEIRGLDIDVTDYD